MIPVLKKDSIPNDATVAVVVIATVLDELLGVFKAKQLAAAHEATTMVLFTNEACAALDASVCVNSRIV